MSPGDLVQYRSRIETDPDPESVPKHRQRWGRTGIVISVGDWRSRELLLPGKSITFMDSSGDIIEACAEDLSTIQAPA